MRHCGEAYLTPCPGGVEKRSLRLYLPVVHMSSRPPLAFAALVAASCISITRAIDNGLGRKPALGWSTWCTEGACSRDVCTEAEVLSVADALADSGLQALGWTLLALDDCWEADARDGDGQLVANATRFPSGMRNLTDTLRARGFIAGLYTSLGYETCHASPSGAPIPGSYGHFAQDSARIVREWGFAYLKGDWCKAGGLDIGNTTVWMGEEMNGTGVPNMFTFHGIAGAEWTTGSGNFARVYSDHHDVWTSPDVSGTGDIIALMALWGTGRYAGPQPPSLGGGFWFPDFDFLMTGGQGCPDAAPGGHCPGQSDVEYRTEFSFWALGSGVLIVATDPRNLTTVMKEALFNEEIIAVNQEGAAGVALTALLPCGLPAACQLWHRTNGTGTVHAIVFNPSNTSAPAPALLNFTDVGLTPSAGVAVRDLWLHSGVGVHTGSYSVDGLGGHEARVLQLIPQHRRTRAGGAGEGRTAEEAGGRTHALPATAGRGA